MNNDDDYKRGLRDGFKDGFEAGRKSVNKPQTPPWELKPERRPWEIPMGPPQVTCSKCGMSWSGVMGYYCPKIDCPIQPKAT